MPTPRHEQNGAVHHSLVADREAAVHTAPSVLFVIGQFLPRVGGAEVLTQREAAALRSLGHRMQIVTLRLDRAWPAHEEHEGVHIRRTGGLFIGNKLRLRFGAQWLAEIRLAYELLRSRASYDILHIR